MEEKGNLFSMSQDNKTAQKIFDVGKITSQMLQNAEKPTFGLGRT